MMCKAHLFFHPLNLAWPCTRSTRPTIMLSSFYPSFTIKLQPQARMSHKLKMTSCHVSPSSSSYLGLCLTLSKSTTSLSTSAPYLNSESQKQCFSGKLWACLYLDSSVHSLATSKDRVPSPEASLLSPDQCSFVSSSDETSTHNAIATLQQSSSTTSSWQWSSNQDWMVNVPTHNYSLPTSLH